MATLDEAKAAAQATLDALNNLDTSEVTVTEVDVKESDGSEVVTHPDEEATA